MRLLLEKYLNKKVYYNQKANIRIEQETMEEF